MRIERNILHSLMIVGAVATFAACVIGITALIVVDRSGEPTIPEPPEVVVTSDADRFVPIHTVPTVVRIKTLYSDYRRFRDTLLADISTHGGWVEFDIGRSYSYTAVVPEPYLERIKPLTQASSGDEIHPQYQAWTRGVAPRVDPMPTAPKVALEFRLFQESFARPHTHKLINMTIVGGGFAVLGMVILAVETHPSKE